jgi:hypothetical protein
MSNIIHWDRLIHKGVRSKDMQDMGNVIAIDDQSVTMMQGRHEFKMPISCVDDFNGSEVFLSITESDAQKYKTE